MKVEKSNRELANFVVENGRVLQDEGGLFEWESLSNEIEFEAQERGWDNDEIKEAVEWAFNAMGHNGH